LSGRDPKERAALVTGGARGIGLAIVEALAARGDRVTIADVDVENARASAAALTGRGWEVQGIALDVTIVEEVGRVVSEVDGQSPLTTVVCNAGLGQIGGVLETSPEEYDRVLAVNLKGVFFTMQAALRAMVPRGRGSVVSISSTSGFTASSTPMAVYDVSKAAVRMLTTAAAREVGRTGVRVNAVAPGTVGTDLVRAVLSNDAIERLEQDRIPVGRLAEPREIAAAVAWLSSDDASYVTGHTLVADGGWLT
jgi:NAD(P)-dependent dehydrogenase (short-subunit alcohol dehydrogenase family)